MPDVLVRLQRLLASFPVDVREAFAHDLEGWAHAYQQRILEIMRTSSRTMSGAHTMPMLEDGDEEGVSPPGWQKTVEHMKKHPEIETPWALAWWMKERGDRPHYAAEDTHDDDECPVVKAWRAFQKEMGIQGHAIMGRALPMQPVTRAQAAARGELWAQAAIMGHAGPVAQEARR